MSASVVAILFAAAISPGPNNIVVMNAAARSRLAAAAAPIAGIVLGTLTLVLAVRFGVDAVLDRWVHGRLAMRLLGASLIVYLAVRIVAGGWHHTEEATGSSRAEGKLFTAMLAFQILNPKTWVLALTVSSAHAGVEDASVPGLITAVLIVPSLCLLLWAMAGRVLQPFMAQTAFRRIFVSVMGVVLAMFAAILALDVI